MLISNNAGLAWDIDSDSRAEGLRANSTADLSIQAVGGGGGDNWQLRNLQ